MCLSTAFGGLDEWREYDCVLEYGSWFILDGNGLVCFGGSDSTGLLLASLSVLSWRAGCWVLGKWSRG